MRRLLFFRCCLMLTITLHLAAAPAAAAAAVRQGLIARVAHIKAMPACRKLLQGIIDPSQRALVPRGNPIISGSSNTANAFSSTPGDIRRIGALGFGSTVAGTDNLSASRTTVVAGVRGIDNSASGSGSGVGPGSGTTGSYRGYSSTGRGLLQRSSVGSLAALRRLNPRADVPGGFQGADRSAGSIQRADVDTGVYGLGSGSFGGR